MNRFELCNKEINFTFPKYLFTSLNNLNNYNGILFIEHKFKKLRNLLPQNTYENSAQ